MANTAQDWYDTLVDDCRAVLSKKEIEGYHELGKRVFEEKSRLDKLGIPAGEIILQLQESLGRSRVTLWRAIQFYKKYPVLSDFPDKKANWNRISKHYLPPVPKLPKEESQKEGMISRADFSTVTNLVKTFADITESLATLNTSSLDKDAVDYLCSELKITLGKGGNFLLKNDKR